MMLLHGYPQVAAMGVPGNHGSNLYMQNLGPSRPMYKGVKEEGMMSVSGGPPQQSLYGQSISLIPSMGYGTQGGQANPKRSRSPSPPPQLYHAYKPHSLSPYNSSSSRILFLA